MIADTTFETLAMRPARRRSEQVRGPRINLYAVAGLALSVGLWGGIAFAARALLAA
jgi:hypothetical protein